MKRYIKIILILCCIMLFPITAYTEEIATVTDLSEETIIQREIPPVIINIWFEYETPLHMGDLATLCSEVIGGEGQILEYQWQYLDPRIDDPLLEDGWHDIIGANESIYEFIIDRENALYYYRLQVTHYWPKEDE